MKTTRSIVAYFALVVLTSVTATVLRAEIRDDELAGLERLLASDSVYIFTQGVDRVREEKRSDLVPVLLERLIQPGTDLAIVRGVIDTLPYLDCADTVKDALDTAFRMKGVVASTTPGELPEQLQDIPSFLEFLRLAPEAVSQSTLPYLIYRLGDLSAFADFELIAPFIERDGPPLLRVAGLLAIASSSIPAVQMADHVFELARNDQPQISALAYYVLCKKLPPNLLGPLVADGLKSPERLIREAIIHGITLNPPPSLGPAIVTFLENERDDALHSLALEAQVAVAEATLYRDLCSVLPYGAGLLAILTLLTIPFMSARKRRLIFEQGLKHIDRADYALAVRTLAPIAHSNSTFHLRALLHLLRAYVRLNRMEDAHAAFEKLNPRNYAPDDLYALAIDLDGKGLKERAVRVYLQLLKRYPNYGDVQARFDAIADQLRSEASGTAPPTTPHKFGQSLIDILRENMGAEYDEFSLLGRGGMGAVYRVRHKSTQELLAVKVLLPALAEKESIRTRFYRESVAIANLAHPNICKIRDIKKGNIPYIIMEYIEGKNLKALIEERSEPFSPTEFFSIAIPSTSALAFAHSKHIIHRDIKPDNILVNKLGAPKLVDFGLVKFREAASDITSTGDMMGTPMYMSPEQLRGEIDVDHRTDIYSLGLTLFALLTLSYPFPTKAIFQRVFMEPESARLHNPNVPAMLDQIVLNCIANDPEERPDSADELGTLLEGAREFWR